MIDIFSNLDQKLLLLMNSWHAEWLNPVMIFLSGQIIWTPFIAFVLFFSFKSLKRSEFYLFVLFLLLTIIASDVTSSYILKNIFDRLRPCREVDLKPLLNLFGQKCGGKYGFVSSHAANSLCIFLFSYLSIHSVRKYLKYIWILPLIVSFSRIYLGVHYPGDILGGFLVGAMWAFIMSWFFNNRSWGQAT